MTFNSISPSLSANARVSLHHNTHAHTSILSTHTHNCMRCVCLSSPHNRNDISLCCVRARTKYPCASCARFAARTPKMVGQTGERAHIKRTFTARRAPTPYAVRSCTLKKRRAGFNARARQSFERVPFVSTSHTGSLCVVWWWCDFFLGWFLDGLLC